MVVVRTKLVKVFLFVFQHCPPSSLFLPISPVVLLVPLGRIGRSFPADPLVVQIEEEVDAPSSPSVLSAKAVVYEKFSAPVMGSSEVAASLQILAVSTSG